MIEFPSGLTTIAEDYFDVSLEAFGKICTVYYTPVPEASPDVTNNFYVAGGPTPFEQSYSQGNYGIGFRAKETTDTITLTVDWEPKKQGGIRYPDGSIMVRGYIEDFPKVVSCDYLVIHTAMEPYKHFRYKLFGEPGDGFSLVKTKYFIAVLQRAG